MPLYFQPFHSVNPIIVNLTTIRIQIFFEKKGRAGKPATIIDGFPSDGSEDKICNELAGTLKKRLGRGGSARGGEILIQGDCRESLRKILRELGYEVKG